MNDLQVMHAMQLDDAYHVEKILADGVGGITEIVTIGDAGPFVRKKIPSSLARRRVWSTLSECECARLPRVEATYELPEYFVVVYDFVPGDTLEHIVETSGRFSSDAATKIAFDLCEAAAALHCKGIVHRDIAPGNIVMSSDGAHLIDLGIARFRVEGASKDTASLGTWGFASPEQYGFAQTDARSDVYSIGRVLGYALTGILPGADEYEKATTDVRIAPSSVRDIIRKACAFEPSARYQNAEDLSTALAAARSECCEGNSSNFGNQAGETMRCADSVAAEVGNANSVAASTSVFAGHYRVLHKVAIGIALVLLCSCAAIVAWFAGHDSEKSSPARGSAMESSVNSSNGKDAPESLLAYSDDSIDEAAAMLKLGETSWHVVPGGYICYAVEIVNENDALILFPEVEVRGYSADGPMTFSSSQVFSLVDAHESYIVTGQAGNGVIPDRVEFSVLDTKDWYVKQGGKAPSFEVSDANMTHGAYGTTDVVGVVTTVDEGDGTDLTGLANITVVFRSKDGSLMGAAMTSVNRPTLGKNVAFDIPVYDVPDYDTYEIVAHA